MKGSGPPVWLSGPDGRFAAGTTIILDRGNAHRSSDPRHPPRIEATIRSTFESDRPITFLAKYPSISRAAKVISLHLGSIPRIQKFVPSREISFNPHLEISLSV
ncbi:hypothetical protein [Burkholderia gladioli]|uniref:hypothetical protein n=1 Tax=Burkholderia gladioli TaxID=28095 RepID=UPI00163F5345|nr:hypothetical protein [Burkholderia gladioli]